MSRTLAGYLYRGSAGVYLVAVVDSCKVSVSAGDAVGEGD